MCLAYAYLVLIAVHPRQRTNVGEDILQGIRQLECIDIAKAELNMCVDNELGEPKNLAT
jgi:hypothetical protein